MLGALVGDLIGGVVTHLVVEPKHRRQPGLLVPLELVDDTTGTVRLSCDVALPGVDLEQPDQGK